MESRKIIKHYSNGEVTVIWQPDMCIHSTKCFHGLPHVFDPRKRPWITPEKATTEEIIEQIGQCPSGALSFKKETEIVENKPSQVSQITEIELLTNGPLLIKGTIEIKDAEGNSTEKEGVTALCRCGASGNKPFCDGTHSKIGFKA